MVMKLVGTKNNHCIIVSLMGICSNPDDSCTYFKQGVEDCIFHCNLRCCHSVAMGTSTKVDRRSREELKHLLNGI
jgi:hypothetical protein